MGKKKQKDKSSNEKNGNEEKTMNSPNGKENDNEDMSQVSEKQLIDSLQKENAELKDKLIRKTAELDNVIKRCEKEKLNMIDYANEKLIIKLLELVDDLDNAVESGKKSHDPETILTGVEMIHQKAMKLLEDEGVKPLDSAEGKPFDVNLHDAMVSMPSEQPEGTVIQEIQKGYTLRDKVIRHSKVVTSSGEADDRKEHDND
jgi:molecular chaperone GrpE